MNRLVAIAIVAAASTASADVCRPATQLPRLRRGGALLVESPPRPPRPQRGTRLRSHVLGSMGKLRRPSDARIWAGPEVPAFVPLTIGTKELFLLDPLDDRYMALYREPYDVGGCASGEDQNCAYEVRVFDCAGDTIASVPLNPFLSKPGQLEVQDIRLVDNVLYFNEACVSYAKEQGGACSALVAVDIRNGRLMWRTRNLVSNDVFMVDGGYIITGYGFTAEPSSLFIVRRSDGAVVAQQPLKQVVYPGGNHDDLVMMANNVLQVGISGHPDRAYIQLVGIEGAKPSFRVITEPKPISHTFNPDGTRNPNYKPPPPPVFDHRP